MNKSNDLDKFFNFFEKHFIKIFITMAVLVVLFWCLVGFMATKLVTEVNQTGLKTFIERIWEGQ